MRPIRTPTTTALYRGAGDVGDLYVRRVKPGHAEAVYELDDDDRAAIAAGAQLVIGIHTEPMPPISAHVEHEEKIEDQPFRVPRA